LHYDFINNITGWHKRRSAVNCSGTWGSFNLLSAYPCRLKRITTPYSTNRH